MTELIMKATPEQLSIRITEKLAPYKLPPLMIERIKEMISAEVEAAYKAGMIHFNAFDHTLKIQTSEAIKQWSKEDLTFMAAGSYETLPSLYLRAKGFKL